MEKEINPTPIKYTVEDLEENVSNQATITITAVQTADGRLIPGSLSKTF
jgi:hypothetical protein